ncbi:MAG: FMN-binding negative transcriptional regulator [Pseudomonadota bacterium]
MYSPSQFHQLDPAALQSLVVDHPLATLVLQSPQGLSADHVPLMLRPQEGGLGALAGHVARANPLWRLASPTVDVLAVFQGPQAYISPQWYATKPRDGRAVPTWNYAVVHVQGQLRAMEDPVWLRAQLDELTAQQERRFLQPWSLADAPPEYTDRLLQAIVGIEITITGWSGKWKVSQNQPPVNQRSVVVGLQAQATEAASTMADWVVQACPGARSEPAALAPDAAT